MTIRTYLRSLNILHLALLAGMVMLTVILFLFAEEREVEDQFLQTLIMVLAIISIASLFGGLYIFRKIISGIDKKLQLAEKLHKYRGASIVKWAMLEAPVLLSAICYFITNQTGFLITSVGLILFFMLHRPAKARIVNDLVLSADEMNMLNDGNTRI